MKVRVRLYRWVPFLFVFALFSSSVSQGQNSSPMATQIELEQLYRMRPPIAIGSDAPDFSLLGVDGKKHQLSDYKNSRILAIVFTCNHCPTSQIYEERIKSLVTEYRSKGVAVIAIQPNSDAATTFRDFSHTDVDNSIEGMTIRSKSRQFNFPYLYDGGDQAVAEKYRPTATPHIFIFDKQRKLQYEGRIDDNEDVAKVKTQDAKAVLNSLLSGRPVATSRTAVFGCATKWKAQSDVKQKEIKDWESRPVSVDAATADVLKKLRTNPTGKFLMVNFWATWCGPCVVEFDDLLQTYQWYRNRNFELVTVSADAPDGRASVLRFLKEHHSGVRNLQFASEDVYAMQAAFDTRWDSGVPYTIVLSPDGKVIYERMGEVDLVLLRRRILQALPSSSSEQSYWQNVRQIK